MRNDVVKSEIHSTDTGGYSEILFGAMHLCWNYLYFTQKIIEAESEELKQELITGIRNGSVVTWQHINLHGEYNFSDEKLQDSVGLNAPEILAMKEI